MDIMVTKGKISYCSICNEVSEARDAWDAEQTKALENGEVEEAKAFDGVDGYIIKDADPYKYNYNQICGKCMCTITKCVNLITANHLTGISVDSNTVITK